MHTHRNVHTPRDLRHLSAAWVVCASAASLAKRSSRRRATFSATASRSCARRSKISLSCFLRCDSTASALRRASALRAESLMLDLLVAFALHALAQHFAMPADGLALLPGAPLRRLLIGTPALHLAEGALALHLLLENA